MRNICALLLLLLLARPAAAQRLLDFTYTDSLTHALLTQHRWQALDSVGRAALRLGVDYPTLRRRLGLAGQLRGRPARALRHYAAALRDNAADTLARTGLALAYLALGQRELAAAVAPGLRDSLRQRWHLGARQLVSSADVELSGQTTTSRFRGNAGYARLGLGSRLSSHLSLLQSLSYYGQHVELLRFDQGRPRSQDYSVRQGEYAALLGYQLDARWRAKLGYHYLHSYFGTAFYPGHLGLAALHYTRPYWQAQASAYAGRLTAEPVAQTSLRLVAYPLGNLKLYPFGQFNVVFSQGRRYPNYQLGLGTQLRRWLWLEAYGSAGRVPVLAEADGTYVYNLLDPLGRRAGASLHILLPHSLLLRLHYLAEQRYQYATPGTYNLFSLTTSLAWTW
ncbi:hypothetical protein Q5H93_18935 [Hymenobacter sp. ASUV-10]|uniref:Tetratricopeptide repeat protein n=1 Tax=Hymenobacter aranciens TaxID=3063996 RepID=A0ABT9BEX3_9BACT|nr:hypothetical protein [Hymenobacter sp. ASUV-10]MDO7876828.1 hypothetical protein [Hymenobacter sp. ASUV-10]